MFTDLAPHLKRGFDYSQFKQPGIVYFLRHINCPFARRALKSFAKHQDEIKQAGFSLMFVHMSSDADFREVAHKLGLTVFKSISDPDLEYYAAFNVKRAGPSEMRSWQAMVRQLIIGYHSRPDNTMTGDINQMNGMFVIHQEIIHEAHRPESISDNPDISDLLSYAKTIVQVQKS